MFLRVFLLRRNDHVVRKAFNAGVHLGCGDVTIDDRTDPRVVKVHLCWSKTDQLRNRVDVVVERTQDSLGPVAAVCAFMDQRDTSQVPFFVLPDGTQLTKAKFSEIVKIALKELGLPKEQ